MPIPLLPAFAQSPRIGRTLSAPSSGLTVSWLALLLILSQAFAAGLHAQITTTWTGAAGFGNWATGSNWDQGVPGSTDTAVVGSLGTAELTGAGFASVLNVGETDIGELLISGGTLAVGSDSSLGNNGGTGTATVTSGIWSTGSSLIVGFGSGTGSLTIAGGTVSSNIVQVAFSGTSTGTLNLNGGVLATTQIVENGGGGSGLGHVNFNGGTLRATAGSPVLFSGFETGDIQFAAGGAIIDTQTFAVTIANILQGAGGLTKQGAGTLNLVGSSSYTGGTTVSLGTLALIAGSGRLADTGALTVSGGTFSIGSISDTVGAVTLNTGSITGTSGTLTGSSYAVESGTVSAKLGGSGALSKATAGTVTLSGTNTYTGATTINGGLLAVTGSITTSSLTTINIGGTLAGTGTVGATTLNGGTIAPGNSPGTLTLNGNVTLTTGTLSFALASPTSDQIVISGTGLTLTGNNTGAVLVSLLDLDSTAALGSYTLISVVGSGITPSNWGLSAFTLNTPSQWAGSFLSMGGNGFDLIVTVIPEPGTYAAFAGVAALALAMIHRSRRRLSVQ